MGKQGQISNKPFNLIKAMITNDVVLAYSSSSEVPFLHLAKFSSSIAKFSLSV
jgi:hypothetical protein